MLLIPINTEESTLILVVLEKDNLDRMKQADPITMSYSDIKDMVDIRHPNNYHLVVAYEENTEYLISLIKDGKISVALKYLNRGYNFIPGIDGNISLFH